MPTGWTARLGAALSGRIGLAALLALCVSLGLTLHEVLPRYQVVPQKQQGELWQDHPTFLLGDCVYYRATVLSLLADGDLDLANNLARKQYSPSSNVSQGRNGEWYPKHPVLMPLCATPFYWALGDVGLLVFNLLALTALALCLWAGARRCASEPIALAVVLWFVFGTMLRPRAYNFSPDVFSSLWILLSFLALFSGRTAAAGGLLGLALGAKWTNAVFFPLVGAYFLVRRDWRGGLRCALGAAPFVLAWLALNWHMFGSPWVTPYDRVLVLAGGEWVLEPSHRSFFGVPFWTGLWEQLTDRQLGLLTGCPPILLAPFGVYWLARRRPAEALLVGGACLAQLATFAKYELWRATLNGPRFLLTAVALSAWLVAPALEMMVAGLRARAVKEPRA